MALNTRLEIIYYHNKGMSLKKLLFVYSHIGKNALYNIINNHLKYSLNENDIILDKDGDIVKFGRKSYNKIEERLIKWYTKMKFVKT